MGTEPFRGQRVRFVVLLGAFALFFLYSAVAHTLQIPTQTPLAKLLNIFSFVALLSAAALAVSGSRGTRNAVRGFLVFVIVMLAASRLQEQDNFALLTQTCTALFVAWVSFLIIRNVWSLQRADSEAIAASLCAFLLLGLLWMLIYTVIAQLDPAAFGDENMSHSDEEPIKALYFSYVTLTTLGYGDIAPVSAGARMFAILEAITGQVFLVVLVARLVGLSVASSLAPDDAGDPDD